MSLIPPRETFPAVSNETDTCFTCPGWPHGTPCGRKAGTPWTHIYCDFCDQKRRAYIAAAIEGGSILVPSAPEPVVIEESHDDGYIYCGMHGADFREVQARPRRRWDECPQVFVYADLKKVEERIIAYHADKKAIARSITGGR